MTDSHLALAAHLSRTWLGGEAELETLAESAKGDQARLEGALSRWVGTHAVDIAGREVRALVTTGADNPWETVLRSAEGGGLSWLEDYGLPVREEERELAAFLYEYPAARRREIGVHIVEAFLHGFLSQSRTRRSRRRVRLNYWVGQEALAREVLRALEERGLQAVVQQPQCLAWSGAYAMAHGADRAACLSDAALEALLRAYDLAYRRNSPELLDTCGMIGIGQFGEAAGVPGVLEGAYVPGGQRRRRLLELENAKREMEARYLAPSDLSFCKVAFPNLLVGENFPAVFDAFCALNTMESEKYELIQQALIDALDTCERVELEGAAGNDTRLTVMLRPLGDGSKETNFLNCGGDLNIPHGELFTTPVLAGTTGTLHVKEIYLKGVYFRDLKLEFRDGMIASYGCGGCADEPAGRAYVKEHLLQGHDTLPMGEFAIGSNTLAYAIARDMDLLPRMPILLAEKMGPHVAVGDPCFARGEDAPVYNLYDKKEMTARENERTGRRGTGEEVYTNVHTDITLAFDELARLDGVRPDGERVPILRDGRFVLPGTECLNEPLERGVQR